MPEPSWEAFIEQNVRGRDMVEEIMDDEDEVRDLNLSSRPLREDRRKVRERERLERGMARSQSQQSAAEGGAESIGGGRTPSRNGSWTVNGTSKTSPEEQSMSRRDLDSR
jgi:hypothetical protein